MAYAPKAYVATNYTTEAFAGHRLTCGAASITHLRCFHQRFFCGESEIRTHGTVSSTLPFQGSTIDRSVISPMAEREGFEPPVRCRTPVFKTGAFDHSATSPYSVLFHISPTTQWTWVGFWLRCSEELYTENLIRAAGGTWTPDRLITNQLLYQLSYNGF